MTLTKKQVDLVIKNTKPELKGTQVTIAQSLGYYMKSQANWSYQVGWTYEGDLVCTVFGEVR